MATQTIYSVESPTSNVGFTVGIATHVLVLTDATNVVAIMDDASTVDYGDPLAGTIIVGSIDKITFDSGTFRTFHTGP